MMIKSQTDRNTNEAESVVSMWNKERLSNKGKWVFQVINTSRMQIYIKSFDCWIQIIEINDSVKTGSPMFNKVGDIKQWLFETVFHFLEDNQPSEKPVLVQVFD